MRHGAQMPERRAVAELSRGLSTAFVDNRRELSGDTRTGLGSSGRVAPRVGAWVETFLPHRPQAMARVGSQPSGNDCACHEGGLTNPRTSGSEQAVGERYHFSEP